jgi:hypothetical protein
MSPALQIVPAHQHPEPVETAADRISALHGQRDAILNRIQRLETAMARLQTPVDDEAALRAEFGAIAAREAADAKEWAQSGDGEPPLPRKVEREELARHLEEVTQLADAARAAAAELGASIHAAHQELKSFVPLISAEVLDFLQEMGGPALDEVREAADQHRAALAAALAIADAAFDLGRVEFARTDGGTRDMLVWAALYSDQIRDMAPRAPGDAERRDASGALRQTILDMTKGIVTP